MAMRIFSRATASVDPWDQHQEGQGNQLRSLPQTSLGPLGNPDLYNEGLHSE